MNDIGNLSITELVAECERRGVVFELTEPHNHESTRFRCANIHDEYTANILRAQMCEIGAFLWCRWHGVPYIDESPQELNNMRVALVELCHTLYDYIPNIPTHRAEAVAICKSLPNSHLKASIAHYQKCIDMVAHTPREYDHGQPLTKHKATTRPQERAY